MSLQKRLLALTSVAISQFVALYSPKCVLKHTSACMNMKLQLLNDEMMHLLKVGSKCAIFIQSSLLETVNLMGMMMSLLGCGISFWMPSIIGPSISVVAPSSLVIHGANVEH